MVAYPEVFELNDKRICFTTAMDLDSLGLVMLFGSDSQMALEDSGYVILETGLDVSELYAPRTTISLNSLTIALKIGISLKSLPMTGASSVMRAPRILEHLGCYQKHRWRPGRLSLTGLQPIPRDRGLGFRFIKTAKYGNVFEEYRLLVAIKKRRSQWPQY